MLSSMSWKLVSFAFQLIILISIVVFFMVESSALRRAFPAGGEYEDVGDDDMHAGFSQAEDNTLEKRSGPQKVSRHATDEEGMMGNELHRPMEPGPDFQSPQLQERIQGITSSLRQA
jgi:hypothetical protein